MEISSLQWEKKGNRRDGDEKQNETDEADAVGKRYELQYYEVSGKFQNFEIRFQNFGILSNENRYSVNGTHFLSLLSQTQI